jgi:hypothetical protein
MENLNFQRSGDCHWCLLYGCGKRAAGFLKSVERRREIARDVRHTGCIRAFLALAATGGLRRYSSAA